jgi:hypothetical protein
MLMTERSWPSLDEVREKAKKNVLDDRMANVPPYELQNDEILGLPIAGESARPAEKSRKVAPRKGDRDVQQLR